MLLSTPYWRGSSHGRLQIFGEKVVERGRGSVVLYNYRFRNFAFPILFRIHFYFCRASFYRRVQNVRIYGGSFMQLEQRTNTLLRSLFIENKKMTDFFFYKRRRFNAKKPL